MNGIVSIKQVKTIATYVSLSFLFIHVCMVALFSLFGVTPMVWFNAFSIVFYLASIVLIRSEWFRAYVISVFLEVVAHMVFAVINVGWNAGFQVTLIGMCVLAYFAEYLGRSLSTRFVPGLALSIVGMCAYVFSYEYVWYNLAPYHLPDDVSFWLQVAWGIVVFVIAVLFLQVFVTVTFESEKILSVKLAHDNLTGLPNRYFMIDHLRALENKGKLANSWVAMIDIDDFKKINDNYGHNCGDYVLHEIAQIVPEGKAGAVLCRWGGEEFLMVGPTDSDMDAQVSKLDNLRKAIAEHGFWYEEQRLRVSVTIGVAAYEDGQSVSEWINSADKKLYQGKTSGKNKVVS